MKLTRSKFTFLIVLVLILLVLGCIDEGGIEEVQDASSTTEKATSTPIPDASPEKGSYKNPVEIGDVITLSSYGETFKVSVIDVIRGQKANSLIAAANMFNEEPISGYEYCIVKVQLEYAEGDDSTMASDWDFKVYSDNVELETGYADMPDNYQEFTTGNIMPGGIKTGWLTYLVPQNKEVIISYQPNMFSDNAAYISLGY